MGVVLLKILWWEGFGFSLYLVKGSRDGVID